MQVPFQLLAVITADKIAILIGIFDDEFSDEFPSGHCTLTGENTLQCKYTNEILHLF